MSSEYLRNALEGIEYLQLYYQNALLLAVCLSMLGWMVFLVQRVAFATKASPKQIFSSRTLYICVAIVTMLLLTIIYRNLCYDYY